MIMETLLNNAKVHMRDVATVERKLKILTDAGKSKLLVISDFDYTLTRFHDELGNRCWTTHGVFDAAAASVSSTLAAKFERLKAKYLPIEFDPHLTVAEKTPHMEDWWRTSHTHIVEAGFTREAVQKFVETAKLEMRNGAQEMILTLHEHRVPFVIFSAGVGNIIYHFLQKTLAHMPRNIHVISNMMVFDENDVVNGFSEPLIHTFSKNSTVIQHRGPLFEEIKARRCVVLLGDSMGDLHMDDGVEDEEVALKIGFLNFNSDALLSQYLDGYDIVLVDDQTMDVPQVVIKQIFLGSKGEASDSDGSTLSRSTCRVEAEDQREKEEKSKNPVDLAPNAHAQA